MDFDSAKIVALEAIFFERWTSPTRNSTYSCFVRSDPMIFRRTLQDQMVGWVFIGILHIGEEKIFSFLHSKCKKVQNIVTHRTLSFTVKWLLVSFKYSVWRTEKLVSTSSKEKKTYGMKFQTRCYIWLPIHRRIYVLFYIWSVILHVLLLSDFTVALSRMPSAVLETV